MSTVVRVWDLPTRVFHWALAASTLSSLTSALIGGNAMLWHFRFGFGVISLLLFRIIWGVVGGRWSRFAAFIYAPTTVLRYLKGQGHAEHSIGHNPLGAFSVFALLGSLLLQVASGLVSDDEIATVGPLAKFVSNVVVSNATYYHRHVGKPILLVLMALHVGAILFYFFKNGENLLTPMILGDKQTHTPLPSSRDDLASRLLALALFLSCAALVSWVIVRAG